MSYRKGELTPATVDREYPYQVALREKQHNWSCSTIERFCRIHALSVSPRGHAVVIGHHFYVVTCFATPEDAADHNGMRYPVNDAAQLVSRWG